MDSDDSILHIEQENMDEAFRDTDAIFK